MNITGKYLKVWKIEEVNGLKKVTLGDSKKNQDGTYDNWNWFGCLLVGNAKNVPLNEGDKVEVISGQISQKKWNDKWMTNIVIFDIEVMESAKPAGYSNDFKVIVDSEDEIPF